MSKMGDLGLDIAYLLDKGMDALEVARELEIPLSWVYQANEFDAEKNSEENSPFATINS